MVRSHEFRGYGSNHQGRYLFWDSEIINGLMIGVKMDWWYDYIMVQKYSFILLYSYDVVVCSFSMKNISHDLVVDLPMHIFVRMMKQANPRVVIQTWWNWRLKKSLLRCPKCRKTLDSPRRSLTSFGRFSQPIWAYGGFSKWGIPKSGHHRFQY